MRVRLPAANWINDLPTFCEQLLRSDDLLEPGPSPSDKQT
jgi:hypothetical protein